MTTCGRPGCGGTVDGTGFCRRCGRRAPGAAAPGGPVPRTVEPPPIALPDPDPDAVCGPGCTRSTAREDPLDRVTEWTIAGLVTLPVLNPPDPSSRVLADEQTVSARRRCAKDGCSAELGVGYAGQPSVLEGVCPRCGTPYSFRPRLHAGDLVAGQYEVVGPLAQSGFGWVYLAKDRHLDDNYVVLKGLVNVNDAQAAQMALRERQYLTRLSHPNIVRIFNAVTHGDPRSGEHTGYIVMEYVAGPSLDEVRRTALTCRRDCAKLPLEHVLAMGHEILAALDYLHGRGLLYCDMKPDNVIRGRDKITVIDLGGITEIALANRAPVGTLGYQADRAEIHERGATVRSDLHTVGRTLERMRRDADVPPVAAESFQALVRRATDPVWDRRFASAAEMSEQLTGVLRELLSLREHTEHAAPSVLFAPTVALIDGGLGGVPELDRWTGSDRTVVPAHRPPSGLSAALGLPLPRVDPADPAARFLAEGTAHDPGDLLGRIEQGEDRSAELWLRASRANLERRDPGAAASCLRRAAALTGAGDWRLRWYRGLTALAGDDTRAALDSFTAVHAAWPGEPAPQLALALCHEREAAGRPAAEGRFTAVWVRDKSQTSAAFGLARLRLTHRDRAGAAAVLDEVPLMSPHRGAARVAAVRVHVEPIDDPGPTAADLTEAARRLTAVTPDGERRDRLLALVRVAALDATALDATALDATAVDATVPGSPSSPLSPSSPGDPAVLGYPAVLGDLARPDSLRLLLERSYRDLARQARTAEEHGLLVDLANRVRPRTLLAGPGRRRP